MSNFSLCWRLCQRDFLVTVTAGQLTPRFTGNRLSSDPSGEFSGEERICKAIVTKLAKESEKERERE